MFPQINAVVFLLFSGIKNAAFIRGGGRLYLNEKKLKIHIDHTLVFNIKHSTHKD